MARKKMNYTVNVEHLESILKEDYKKLQQYYTDINKAVEESGYGEEFLRLSQEKEHLVERLTGIDTCLRAMGLKYSWPKERIGWSWEYFGE